MDNKTWGSTSMKNQHNHAIFLEKSFSEHPYGRFELGWREPNRPPPSKSSSASSSKIQGFLRKLKRKFMMTRREKMAFGSSRHSNPVIVPYNSYTYSMNSEDHGLTSAEPDALSRSFSARFAPSSRMFNRVQSVRGN
uniref:Uncharacterized protein n=1 Tax=Opuntia streptacantha TaxID=393608 RepID=A0A7C8ZUD1_OPUST